MSEFDLTDFEQREIKSKAVSEEELQEMYAYREGERKMWPSCYCCYRSHLLIIVGMYILHAFSAERIPCN